MDEIDDDELFGIDALGLHATNEERMEMVVMRMPPDQRGTYRRLVFDLGILPSDKRWQFIEMITRYGPEAADAMMHEIGRVNYHFSESEIDAWQERIRAKMENMSRVLLLDVEFDEASEAATATQMLPEKKGSVVGRVFARIGQFIHLSIGALS
ncbi:hypothetical protein JKG47_00425 [Acidithiobacillus sp. MC6.1]|nr:hypothetical protein [Acidithiobacillus sp. MC6.1]